mmetsp:Transcript_36120/g.78814  ORF Transcript_36120/g.78814 Transcript_36120/m.78814 type:complete len:362 (-) Transcript_36120:75-1160(-)
MVAARCVLSLYILLVTVNMSQALQLINASKVPPQSKFSSVGEDHQPGATAPYSLCKDGKLLPQLYLLGAAKSGTTTIAEYLLRNGILTQAYPNIEKEWHFFDWRYYGVQNVTPQFLEGLRHDWMYELPPCTPADEPRMIGNYHPDNLRFVPLPEGSAGGFAQPTHADLPLTLQYFYGEELYPKLTFMVMMRDPLERLQSGWYFSRRYQLDPEDTFAFDRHLREVLQTAKHNGRYSIRLWQSMYGSQLKSWLERFEARQFVFAPMMIAVNNVTSTLSSLSKQLGIPLNETHTHLDENSVSHPSVSEDCSPGTIAMFDHFMEDDHRLLLEELAKASLEGASLVGYTGSLGNRSEIGAWLRSGM